MDKSGGESGPKRPYVPPALTIYGTVRDLTAGLGKKSKPDAPHQNHSTHL
jgi:hypothetical protein